MGQLVSVIRRSAGNGSDQISHFVVAVDDFEKAAAILKPLVPADAMVEASGIVAGSLLARLNLSPGQFAEV
jgi:hypothetical protein